MTKVLRSLNELREVRAFLDLNGHPAFKLSPLGVIRSTLCGYWAYEAVVDQWPDFKALILRPNKERVKEFDFEYRDVYLYSVCPDSMEKLLQTPNALPWREQFSVPVCNVELREVVKRAAQQHGGTLQYADELYEVYVPRDPQAIKDLHTKHKIELPDGMTFGSLKAEHVEEVFHNWTSSRRTEDSQYWIQYIAACAKRMHSVCVYTKDGELVGTTGMYMDGTVGLGYMNPKFRGKNLGEITTSRLAYEVLRSDMDFIGYVNVSNSIVQRLVGQFLTHLPGLMSFLHYIPHSYSKL